jgi:hypothetical protein
VTQRVEAGVRTGARGCIRRWAAFAALWTCSLATYGCAHVAPYERENLAHATMAAADPARPSEDHVRSVQEGAVGGGTTSGGGCGCN